MALHLRFIQIMMEEVAGRCKVKGSRMHSYQRAFPETIDLGIDRMDVGYRNLCQ